MDTSPENILPSDHAAASLVGRVWNPDAAGPSLVCVRDGAILDITSADAPTMRDLLEMDDPAGSSISNRSRIVGASALVMSRIAPSLTQTRLGPAASGFQTRPTRLAAAWSDGRIFSGDVSMAVALLPARHRIRPLSGKQSGAAPSQRQTPSD